MSTARERVQAFIDSHEDWHGEETHISTTGEYGSPVRVSLYSDDLRALLAELASCKATLAEYELFEFGTD